MSYHVIGKSISNIVHSNRTHIKCDNKKAKKREKYNSIGVLFGQVPGPRHELM